jgi:hypothetical protein
MHLAGLDMCWRFVCDARRICGWPLHRIAEHVKCADIVFAVQWFGSKRLHHLRNIGVHGRVDEITPTVFTNFREHIVREERGHFIDGVSVKR